jgi:type I restriction enzyme, S subunit
MMQTNRIKFEDLYLIPSKNGVSKPERKRGSGIKMINMGELFQYDRIGNIPMELVPMSPRELATMCVETGDLLFARQSLVLAGAGKASIVTETNEKTTFESHIIRVRLDKNKADPLFYYFYFKSPYSGIRAIVQQCVQSGIRANDLKKILVKYPTLDIQRKTSHILSTYDDLFDINQRRIKLLEESARLLYREWFIYFRFPGYKKVKMIDGVPEGWKKEKLNQIVSFFGGHAFKSSSYQQEGKYGIVTIKNVQQGSFISKCTDYLEDTPDTMKKHCFLCSGDILLSLTGNVGRVCLVYGGNYLLNQRVAKVEPKTTIPKSFAYWMFNDSMMQKRIENFSSGSAQQNLSPVKLGEQKVILPPMPLLESFDKLTSLINIEIIQLLNQNQKLAQARDLLLPRLMNGTIEV